MASLVLRKPLTYWLSWRVGASIGQIEAADKYNRDYLKPRNLSFYSGIKEIYTGFDIYMFDLSTKRFSPYVYGGIALFHFNPWTYDNDGKKVFLKPLSTEGQGLSQYPSQKPYRLTQIALPFGIGAKYALTECMNIGIEFSQRKTFTDYLDDVSSHYVDENILLQEKGPLAVSLAYRGDELQNGSPYPSHGTQRGTKTEMDWYYFLGVTIEMKISCLKSVFNQWGGGDKHSFSSYQNRCPVNF